MKHVILASVILDPTAAFPTYQFKVHLDETQVTGDDAAPHGDWLRVYRIETAPAAGEAVGLSGEQVVSLLAERIAADQRRVAFEHGTHAQPVDLSTLAALPATPAPAK